VVPNDVKGNVMTLDPRQAGFAWPEKTELTNTSGETITIQPFAANLSRAQAADKLRVGQCYRYYTSDRGILTELEVFYWYAGGHQVVFDFLTEFKQSFDERGVSRLPFDALEKHLITHGFDETTIRVCLRWLLQDGYVAIENLDDGHFLELVKW
jgi:hypothetical protein